MNDIMTIGAATSPVLSLSWTGEAAGARRTLRPVSTVKGTGLPFAGHKTFVGMQADQVQGAGVVRVRIAADPGIPPRWRPVRC